MWEISDDQLTVPLGAVVDVAVDAHHTVYLLDSQVMEVRRIDANGTELPSLGRAGEGPGEFMHPCLLAAAPVGGCIVVQDFHGPAVCLMENGNPRAAPDLNVIRQRFGVTVFMGTARLDDADRLVLSANTTERPYDPTTPDADLGSAVSVFRIKRGDTEPTVLFTSSATLGDQQTVRYGEDIGFYALRCWDADATGRIIYADPSGRYRVFIGHPSDGRGEVLELPLAKGDEEALARRAKAADMPVEKYPRIADVQWITRDRFLVKPTADANETRLWQGGIVELFDISGKSLGRRAIARDYDPEEDALFIRGPIMVIVRGGGSALRSSVGIKARSHPGPHNDTILAEAYDLTPQ